MEPRSRSEGFHGAGAAHRLRKSGNRRLVIPIIPHLDLVRGGHLLPPCGAGAAGRNSKEMFFPRNHGKGFGVPSAGMGARSRSRRREFREFWEFPVTSLRQRIFRGALGFWDLPSAAGKEGEASLCRTQRSENPGKDSAKVVDVLGFPGSARRSGNFAPCFFIFKFSPLIFHL